MLLSYPIYVHGIVLILNIYNGTYRRVLLELDIEGRRKMSKRARSPTLGLSFSPQGEAPTSLSADVSSELSISISSSSASIHSSEGSCASTSEAEDTKAMLLVGCPRCLMYVMLPEVDPKCPKCKSTVLLDFLNNDENTKKTSS